MTQTNCNGVKRWSYSFEQTFRERTKQLDFRVVDRIRWN